MLPFHGSAARPGGTVVDMPPRKNLVVKNDAAKKMFGWVGRAGYVYAALWRQCTRRTCLPHHGSCMHACWGVCDVLFRHSRASEGRGCAGGPNPNLEPFSSAARCVCTCRTVLCRRLEKYTIEDEEVEEEEEEDGPVPLGAGGRGWGGGAAGSRGALWVRRLPGVCRRSCAIRRRATCPPTPQTPCPRRPAKHPPKGRLGPLPFDTHTRTPLHNLMFARMHPGPPPSGLPPAEADREEEETDEEYEQRRKRHGIKYIFRCGTWPGTGPYTGGGTVCTHAGTYTPYRMRSRGGGGAFLGPS